MYLFSQVLVPHSDEASGMGSGLFERLYGRERETAALIYENGLSTAVDVQQALSDRISNASVRTTLNRLVSKGVLTRVRCGSGPAFFYGPALNQFSARELELKQFANDFFDGSLELLADEIADIFVKDRAIA